MTDEGLGMLLRLLAVAISFGVAAVTLFFTLKLWRKITLSQKAVAAHLVFMQLYVFLINLELLQDGVGWRWRLILLIVAQFCLIAFLFEPISLRQQRRQQYLEALNKSAEETAATRQDKKKN